MKTRRLAVAGALLAGVVTIASASGREHEPHDGGPERRPRDGREAAAEPVAPAYLKECGACHLAYPPRLLPDASWRTLMAGLDRHFGEDASLEPEVRAGVERWLVARSRPPRRPAAEPPLRITESPWFRDEHEEVPAGAATRPSIRSLSNCGACHSGAARWEFDEDRARIPRG